MQLDDRTFWNMSALYVAVDTRKKCTLMPRDVAPTDQSARSTLTRLTNQALALRQRYAIGGSGYKVDRGSPRLSSVSTEAADNSRICRIVRQSCPRQRYLLQLEAFTQKVRLVRYLFREILSLPSTPVEIFACRITCLWKLVKLFLSLVISCAIFLSKLHESTSLRLTNDCFSRSRREFWRRSDKRLNAIYIYRSVGSVARRTFSSLSRSPWHTRERNIRFGEKGQWLY